MNNTINSQIIFFKDSCEHLINLLNENIDNNFYFNLNKNYSLGQKEEIKNLNEKIADLLNFNFKLVDKINAKINNLIFYKKNAKSNFLIKENQFDWNLLLFFEFSFYSNLEAFKLESIFFIYQNTFFSTYFFQFLYIYNLNEIFNSSRDQINLYEKIKDNQLEHLNLYEQNIDKKIDLLNFFKEKNNIFFDFNKAYNEASFSNKQLSLKITYYSYNLFKTTNLYDNLLQDYFSDFASFIELADLSHTRWKNNHTNSSQLEFIKNNQKFDLSLINNNLIFYIDLLENKKREIKGFYKKLNEIRHYYFK